MKRKIRGSISLGLLIGWAASALSGFLLFLAPSGQRSGRALLLFELTKREWADIHTWASFLALGVTILHVIVDRKILIALIKCLVKGNLPKEKS